MKSKVETSLAAEKKKKKELRHEKLRQIISSSIPLSNDVFMIFAKNKEFCQEFLRVILQDERLVVIENDIQKYLPTAFSKTVVIDMLCKLGDERLVNVEIQLTDEEYHAKRILHYASKIKSYTTSKGTDYKDIKDLIIVYLTLDDIFKKGSTVYEVAMNVVSDQGITIEEWDAGLKVYYVNTKGLTNESINEYLKILTDRTTSNSKYSITSIIKNEVFKTGGMNMSKEMMEILAEEREEGREEGRVEGREEGKISVLINLVKDKLLSVADAAKRLNMSEDQFEALVK